jgi:hypothetical protein
MEREAVGLNFRSAQQLVLLIICLVFAFRDWRARKRELVEVKSVDEAALLLN